MKKIWKGLIFLKRTNVPRSLVLMAFHHPDSITWRWSVWYSVSNDFCQWPRFHWSSTNGYGYVGFTLPFFGAMTINTQPHMWRTNGDQ